MRHLTTGALAVVVTLLGVYGWAWSSLERSSIARAMLWKEADVGDQYRFPARVIAAGGHVSPLPSAAGEADRSLEEVDIPGGYASFDGLLRATDTEAFLIVHADRLVYERYFAPSNRDTLETSFSVAKSFVSILVGIAIDEGFIAGVQDPITDYIPELIARDPRFGRITIRDLLTMSSGLAYREQDLPLPLGDDVDTYYGTDLRDVALNHTRIERPPGQQWLYNNYNPLLLGIVLERATGMSVSEYMATRLWQPLGAERDATWSLDSDRSGFEKMESGVNAAAADYARFGLLFLHGGTWNETRMVSRDWVRRATSAETATTYESRYGYFWWIDGERPRRFFALGNLGQYVYVAPDTDTVIVRLGRDWGLNNDTWVDLMRDVADRVGGRSPLA